MKVEGFPTTNGSRWVDPQRAPTIEPPPDLCTHKKEKKAKEHSPFTQVLKIHTNKEKL